MQIVILLDTEGAFKKLKEFLRWLWENRGGELHEVEIREYKEEKTRPQEKFYWGHIVTPFAEATGHTPEEMHKIICAKLYGTYTVEYKGIKVELLRKTTTTEMGKEKKMNVSEYDKHIQMASAMASEEGVFVQSQI